MLRRRATSPGHLRTVLALAASAALVAACGGNDSGGSDQASSEEQIKLTVANFNHPDAPETQVVNWWLDQVEERTEGQVTFERYHQESLCKGAEIVECVRDGRADIGSTIPAYTAGLFKMAELMNLPFHTSNAEATTQAYHRLGEEVPQVRAEVEALGMRTLFYNGVDTALIGGKEPLKSIADFKGKAVRTVGEGSQRAYAAIGANPVSVTAAEMYEGMQHGLLDVWTNNLSGADDYNMSEVSDYWYNTGLGVYVNIGTWISEAAWSELPADVQEIMNEVSEDLVAGEGYKEYREGLERKCDGIIEAGGIEAWETWPEAETKKWSDALGTAAVDHWKSQVAEVVDDPDAVYEQYVELLEEAEESSEFVSPTESCKDRLNEG